MDRGNIGDQGTLTASITAPPLGTCSQSGPGEQNTCNLNGAWSGGTITVTFAGDFKPTQVKKK